VQPSRSQSTDTGNINHHKASKRKSWTDSIKEGCDRLAVLKKENRLVDKRESNQSLSNIKIEEVITKEIFEEENVIDHTSDVSTIRPLSSSITPLSTSSIIPLSSSSITPLSSSSIRTEMPISSIEANATTMTSDEPNEKLNYVTSFWNKSAVKRRSIEVSHKLAKRRSTDLRVSTDIVVSTEIIRTPFMDSPDFSEIGTPRGFGEVDQSLLDSPVFPLPMAMAQLKNQRISRRFTLIARSSPGDHSSPTSETKSKSSNRLSAPLLMHPPPVMPLPLLPSSIDETALEAAIQPLANSGRRYSWTLPETTVPAKSQIQIVSNNRLSAKYETDDRNEVDMQSELNSRSELTDRNSVDAEVSEYMDRMHHVNLDPPRNDSTHLYNTIRIPHYQNADDIDTLKKLPSPVKEKTGSIKWLWRKERRKTWMDQMETLGVKDGVLMTDQSTGPPIVRY